MSTSRHPPRCRPASRNCSTVQKGHVIRALFWFPEAHGAGIPQITAHIRRIEAVEKDLKALRDSSASKDDISRVRTEMKKLYDGLHVGEHEYALLHVHILTTLKLCVQSSWTCVLMSGAFVSWQLFRRWEITHHHLVWQSRICIRSPRGRQLLFVSSRGIYSAFHRPAIRPRYLHCSCSRYRSYASDSPYLLTWDSRASYCIQLGLFCCVSQTAGHLWSSSHRHVHLG